MLATALAHTREGCLCLGTSTGQRAGTPPLPLFGCRRREEARAGRRGACLARGKGGVGGRGCLPSCVPLPRKPSPPSCHARGGGAGPAGRKDRVPTGRPREASSWTVGWGVAGGGTRTPPRLAATVTPSGAPPSLPTGSLEGAALPFSSPKSHQRGSPHPPPLLDRIRARPPLHPSSDGDVLACAIPGNFPLAGGYKRRVAAGRRGIVSGLRLQPVERLFRSASMAQSAVSPLGSSAALGLVGSLLLLLGPGGPFVLADSPADRSPAKCLLTGKWRNELGSYMNLSAVENGGFFTGSYQTAVSSTSNPIKPSPLRGFQNILSNRARPTFGFTVRWKFSSSITVFTGQCFVDADGTETLQTSWLLRSEAQSSGDNWSATRVGTNVFKRVK